MGYIDKILRWFKTSDMLVKCIGVNVAVFVLLRVCVVVTSVCGGDVYAVLRAVELPSEPSLLLSRWWTVLTYMFAHYDVLHILFNMLWLYWLGRIFLEYFTPKQFAGLYVLGGVSGAALYVAAYNLLPAFAGSNSYLIGASASILAIVVGVSGYAPDYKVNLLLWGEVSLKWIAIVTIGIDFLSIDVSSVAMNAGGHLAHIGGAAAGLWFALAMRRGHDVTAWLNMIIDGVSVVARGRKKGIKVRKGGKAYTYGGNVETPVDGNGDGYPTEAEIDRILDKLRRSGYGGLTEEEKGTLFSASRKRQ